MPAQRVWLMGSAVLGAALLSMFVLVQPINSALGASAQSKPVKIHRFFTGPDGLTHAEEIEVKFDMGDGGGQGLYKFLSNSGAVLRRAPPGRVNDYHTASRRQYIITLSGHAELVLSGGQTLKVGPGDIELAEDTTGKGHITRTVGNEDRISIAIPVDTK
jgi:hypothetical protein